MPKVKKADSRKKNGRHVKAAASTKNGSCKLTHKDLAEVDAAITVDRRTSSDRRKAADRRGDAAPAVHEQRTLQRRQKVSRRRQIDPTTCERSYSIEEIEFMTALDDYKRTSGRMFPTCSEILEVLLGLGYQKLAPAPSARPEESPVSPAVVPSPSEPGSLCLDVAAATNA